jgi:hypothetical protein
MGTGTCENNFADEDDLNSTSLGAFVTGPLSSFDPYKDTRDYKQLARKGVLKKVVVFGMNESNNDTFWDKHVHISPFDTSWGCPSTDASNIDILKTMGKRQTLVVNYGPDSFHPDPSDCHNGDGGPQ